ncbi:hypothetical protein GCM10027589_54280 [Actinocorallia lasiicapitis]
MSEEPRRLDASALIYLARYGDLIHDAPNGHERGIAIAMALDAALRHRQAGFSRAELARALRLPEADIRDHLDRTTAKPQPPRAPPRPEILQDREEDGFRNTVTSWSGTSSNWSQSLFQSSTNAISQVTSLAQVDGFPGTRVAAAARHATGVLVVSGDPRPGENLFGPEVRAIRRIVEAARLGFWELTCPEPQELPAKLTAHRPDVLHLCAHHENSGIALTGSDSVPLWTDHDTFTDLIHELPTPPKLIILSVCASTPIALKIKTAEIAVVSWPGVTYDSTAALFAEAFYQALAARMDLTAAVRAGTVTASARVPAFPAPALHGSTASPWRHLS